MQSYRQEDPIQESPLGVILKNSLLFLEPVIQTLNGNYSHKAFSQDILVKAKVWEFGDYVNFLLGLIDGVFGALP